MQSQSFEAVWDLLVEIVRQDVYADDVAWFAVEAEATGDVAGADDLRGIARARRIAAMEKRGQLGALLAYGEAGCGPTSSPGDTRRVP